LEQSGGALPPEFMSTHPAHETRIRQLEELMPKALEEYQRARAAGGTSTEY
jgi:predicted Zn-dependent protease